MPGEATIYVNALRHHNIPYCPEAWASFWIIGQGPIFPNFLDVSVYRVPFSTTWIEPGKIVDITFLVRNEGTIALNNIHLTVFLNDSMIANKTIPILNSYSYDIINIVWDTYGLSEGFYKFTTNITTFKGEADLTDNNCTFTIEIRSKPRIHDVAVTDVSAQPLTVYIGNAVKIKVNVANFGDSPETFYITVYYNNTEIASKKVQSLDPCHKLTLDFVWDTSGLVEGVYVIWAFAEVGFWRG